MSERERGDDDLPSTRDAPPSTRDAQRTSSLRRTRRRSLAPMELLPPGTLIAGKYCVLECVGQGGMGAVYAAEHLTMRRTVAIKVLRADLASDPANAARFEREAQAASRIASAHAVTIFDFGRGEDGLLHL